MLNSKQHTEKKALPQICLASPNLELLFLHNYVRPSYNCCSLVTSFYWLLLLKRVEILFVMKSAIEVKYIIICPYILNIS